MRDRHEAGRPSLYGLAVFVCLIAGPADFTYGDDLTVGFATVDITPKIGRKPIYVAGFGFNRTATGVLDPLHARACVLSDGKKKIALVCADLVGLFHESCERIRGLLAGFDYVVVTCTHNHHGPDTLGLWGPHPFSSGIDPHYLGFIEGRCVMAIRRADQHRSRVSAKISQVQLPTMVRDSRLPVVKHDTLTAVSFHTAEEKRHGIIVFWSCHPETLGSKYRKLSSDFVGPLVRKLNRQLGCEAVFVNGAVGGLMTTLGLPVTDASGKVLQDGTPAKAKRYGEVLAEKVARLEQTARPVALSPFGIGSKRVYLPVHNNVFRLAWKLGVLKRNGFYWIGSTEKGEPITKKKPRASRPLAIRTEIALLRLGKLSIAAVPGEVYPELVQGGIPDPADKGADFPDAARERPLFDLLPGPWKVVVGLANDEIGYIIPKRQWDVKAPFCYGRQRPQYGEINSLGPETAPLLASAYERLAASLFRQQP